MKTKIDNKGIELKENLSPFARMTIASKARPDIDIEQVISECERSNVPRSLVNQQGAQLIRMY